jgi:hypothetical protein
MNIFNFFEKVFSEAPLADVHYLSYHKQERDYYFPGVPIRPFTDYAAHKQWMIEKRKQIGRNIHNYRILRELKESKDKKQS